MYKSQLRCSRVCFFLSSLPLGMKIIFVHGSLSLLFLLFFLFVSCPSASLLLVRVAKSISFLFYIFNRDSVLPSLFINTQIRTRLHHIE